MTAEVSSLLGQFYGKLDTVQRHDQATNGSSVHCK